MSNGDMFLEFDAGHDWVLALDDDPLLTHDRGDRMADWSGRRDHVMDDGFP